MRSRIPSIIISSVALILSGCAATVDYYSYRYSPPNGDDPAAKVVSKLNALDGISLVNTDVNGCYMGDTPVLGARVKDGVVHAGAPVFLDLTSNNYRGRPLGGLYYSCHVYAAFYPKPGSTYEITSAETDEGKVRTCSMSLTEVMGAERKQILLNPLEAASMGFGKCLRYSVDPDAKASTQVQSNAMWAQEITYPFSGPVH